MIMIIEKIISIQQTVLSPNPSSLAIRSIGELPIKYGKKIIRVHRNQNFEMFCDAIIKIGMYAGFDFEIKLTDYDDSLSFGDIERKDGADIELLWLDRARYSLTNQQYQKFIASRIAALQKLSHAPIVVLEAIGNHAGSATLADILSEDAGVYIYNIVESLGKIDDLIVDDRRASSFGTRINSNFSTLIARDLTCKLFSSLLRPQVKAIAVDLDNTLYAGVLGEDGPDGLKLTAKHIELQNSLLKLKKRGVILTITSKNDERDVKDLFEQRSDFPLRYGDFTYVAANWKNKSSNIIELAQKINISENDFLMLDDNIAELAEVLGIIPAISLLHAAEDRDIASELQLFPGLHQIKSESEVIDRASDLSARDLRAQLSNSVEDMPTFLSQLGTTITLRANKKSEFERLCEVPIKTNQFNLALQRLKPGQITQYLEHPEKFILSFSLVDRLSDSGNVGAVYGEIYDNSIKIDEFCMSCRALGRGLEGYIFVKVLEYIKILFKEKCFENVKINYVEGPRNAPAIDWLKKWCSEFIINEEQVVAGLYQCELSVAAIEEFDSDNPYNIVDVVFE